MKKAVRQLQKQYGQTFGISKTCCYSTVSRKPWCTQQKYFSSFQSPLVPSFTVPLTNSFRRFSTAQTGDVDPDELYAKAFALEQDSSTAVEAMK